MLKIKNQNKNKNKEAASNIEEQSKILYKVYREDLQEK